MLQEKSDVTFEKRSDNDNRKPKVMEPQPGLAQPTPRRLSLGQRWGNVALTKTAAFWYGLAAMALILILGFSWGGWMTGGGAQKLATTAANTAVVQRLAPICVAQFQADPAKVEKLAELKALNSYQQSDYVTKQGWATMPGEEKPDFKIASACVKLLTQIN